MRILRIVYFEIKQLYSKWFLAILITVLILYAFTSFSVGGSNPRLILYNLNYFVILLLILYLSTSFTIVRPMIDVVFTTQIDPVEYYVARAIATGFIYPVIMVMITVPTMKPGLDITYYAATLLFLLGFFVLFTANIQLIPWRGKIPLLAPILIIIILGYLKPELSPLYGLVKPGLTYVVYAMALLILSMATIPRQYIRELATNAYGVLGEQPPIMPRRLGARLTGLPRTPWGVVWATSTTNLTFLMNSPQGSRAVSMRINVFIILIPLSTSFAIAYCIAALLIHDASAQVFLSSFSFYTVYLLLYVSSASTISYERLWLSLSIDPTRYFRYRMGARALITAIALLPWITAYALQGMRFRPAIYLAIALVSTVMVAPVLSWLVAAYAGQPQVRELQIMQRPMTYSLRVLLILLFIFINMSIYMTPYALALLAVYYPVLAILWPIGTALAAVLLIVSAAFLYYVVISERSQVIWTWLVNKLSENGYM